MQDIGKGGKGALRGIEGLGWGVRHIRLKRVSIDWDTWCSWIGRRWDEKEKEEKGGEIVEIGELLKATSHALHPFLIWSQINDGCLKIRTSRFLYEKIKIEKCVNFKDQNIWVLGDLNVSNYKRTIFMKMIWRKLKTKGDIWSYNQGYVACCSQMASVDNLCLSASTIFDYQPPFNHHPSPTQNHSIVALQYCQ